MTDWQRVSAHRLAGFVAGVLESMLLQYDLVATEIMVGPHSAQVEYDIRSGRAVEITAIVLADNLIADEIAKFNSKQAFEKVVGLKLSLNSGANGYATACPYDIIPLIRTRWGIKNGLTGEIEEDQSAEGTGQGGEEAYRWASPQGEDVCHAE